MACILLIQWALKHFPHLKYFYENVVFNDMPEDWDEICRQLGKPIILSSHHRSERIRGGEMGGIEGQLCSCDRQDTHAHAFALNEE